MSTDTIVVVEDEENLREALKYSLEREGYAVYVAGDGASGLQLVRMHDPAMILLDIMLPELNGMEVCRIIRKESDVPIIMLTAKVEEIDRVVGLEIGADDYVTKPFSTRELLARIRALLRRSKQSLSSPPKIQTGILQVAALKLDPTSHKMYLNGKLIQLRPKEFDLLMLFMSNPGRVYTRDDILDQLWGHDYIGDTRTVDVHVRWLRQKVELNPSEPQHLLTIRGVGYRFDA